MVGRRPVFQAMNSACIFSNVAANRARRLTRRIGSVIETIRRDGPRQLCVNQARLHAREAIFAIDFENLSHTRELDYYASIDRECPARESRARAARCKANSFIVKQGENFRCLLSGIREHYCT